MKISAILCFTTVLIIINLITNAQHVHAWNYTMSLQRDKRIAVVLGVFGHAEFGKTKVQVTNLLLQDLKQISSSSANGENKVASKSGFNPLTGRAIPATNFVAKTWLEFRKIKSVSVAKKLKKQIEKEDMRSCDDLENMKLDDEENDAPNSNDNNNDNNNVKNNNNANQDNTQSRANVISGFSTSTSSVTKGLVVKYFLRYLKYQPLDTDTPLRVSVTFTAKEAGLYAVFYGRCISDPKIKVVSTASFQISQYNTKYLPRSLSGGSSDTVSTSMETSLDLESSFLSIGETPLPTVYLGFAVIFSIGTFFWYRELISSSSTSSKQTGVRKIHWAMLLLGVLKSITLFFQAAVYGHRNKTGATGDFIDVVFVIVGALKTAILFAIVILLATGWSITKSVVTEREQKLILAVLVVQLIVNIALATLEEGAPLGTERMDRVRLFLRVVDLLCALVILIPIVSRAKSQHDTAVHREIAAAAAAAAEQENDESGETSRIVVSSQGKNNNDDKESQRLRTFRTFYVTTFIFMYFTRLVVPYLEAHLGYLWLWVPHMAYELAALIFYFTACSLFHPATLFSSGGGDDDKEEMVMIKNSNNIKKPSASHQSVVNVNPNDLEEVDLN